MSYVNLRFYSDAVTGSLMLVNFMGDKILVDCGNFFEGPDADKKNFQAFDFDPATVKAVLITHGHIDHIGRLPWLVKCGFNGKIYCTKATAAIIPIALRDGYNIQQRNKSIRIPYSERDIENVVKLLEPVGYEMQTKISEDICCTFMHNAHIFGASSIYLSFDAYGMQEKINLFFTGDYKKSNSFYKTRRTYPYNVLKQKVTIITESTYGASTTTESQRYFDKLLIKAIQQGRTVLIPTFSLGRTQEVLLRIKELENSGALPFKIPVEYAGKLGKQYTEMLLKGYFDVDRNKYCIPEAFSFAHPKKEFGTFREQTSTQKILLASSGNGSNGFANSYIREWLGDKRKTIIFTGYCPKGTLGRSIIEGEDDSVIEMPDGQRLIKRAEVYTCGRAFSAHADQNELLDLMSKFEYPQSIIITHGEEEEKLALKARLQKELSCKKISVSDSTTSYTISNWGIEKETKYLV